MFRQERSLVVRFLVLPVVLLLTLAATASAQAQPRSAPKAAGNYWFSQEVRHQLLLLPWYSVFDNLEYKVNGSEVTLLGQVVQPRTKEDAEYQVKKIDGVTKVDNQIEVLPLSPNDDQIRRAEYRAIFSDQTLQKYSFGSVQPVHIVVKNGNVTLEGAVLSQADKTVMGMRANMVPGVFSVTNNLRIENSKTEGTSKGQS